MIGRDTFFVQRQLWIDRLQKQATIHSDIKTAVLWVCFGILATACLIVGYCWQ